MNPNRWLLLLAFVLAAIPVGRVTAEMPDRPNILYFYVDDMGWGSIGPNGQSAKRDANKPYVRTPNLNRLAAEGVNFTRGYGCHVCSPARSSQQTGFHQGHTFADRNDRDNAKKAMRAEDICMGDALSAAGYVTGYWGKWGYGGSKDMAQPVIDNVQTLPTSHGYQHVLAELHHVRAHTFFQPTLWSAPAPSSATGGLQLVANSLARYQNNADYPNTPALQNHADYPDSAYCDDAYAFAAIDFVRTQGKNYNETGQPFFGLLAVQIPHAPFDEITVLPNWDQAYARDPHYDSLADQTRQWAAMVTRIDSHFGNLIAALEDPNNDGDTADSVAENTLVIFQSDNGGPGGDSNRELNANGGLRGSKGKIQEGGIRVPLVMRWPAKINSESALKSGSSSNMIVDVTDLLPTFCELAGAPTPLGIDGVSVAPTLLSAGYQRRREFIIHEAGNGQSIIRNEYKLVRSGRSAGKSFTLELYNLESDHAEENDIAAAHPKLVMELEGILLGERVAEPAGFANTYHHWTGKTGGSTSDPGNWSDYVYGNSGITYMTDDGAPQLSWTATIENTSGKQNVALADADLEFLALEIRGDRTSLAPQSLVLGAGIDLTGRNEIRIASNAALFVNGGTLSSLRWIDVLPGSELVGFGLIDTTVHNNGTIKVLGDNQPEFVICDDYRQSKDAVLNLTFQADSHSSIQVNGTATLAGNLHVTFLEGFKPAPGKSYTLLAAKNIIGTFDNPNHEIAANDGKRFSIVYSDSKVSLKLK